ncbi:MAG: DinB family protein [Candidatus Kariarchaeaceae archaeon]
MDLENIRTFYPRLEAAVSKLTPEQINFPTGEGKWTPGQYLHHLADAQAQAFYRCVWILWHSWGTIPYNPLWTFSKASMPGG